MDSLTYLIALGANLPHAGDAPAQTLLRALAALPAEGLHLRALSRFYRTPAFPPGAGPDFVNACATVTAALPPEAVLAALHRIEAGLGRTRQSRWEARKIDLDLLAAGAAVRPDAATEAAWRTLPPARQTQETPATLILPHPRLAERGFVLIPLAEIAPGWRHPATGQSVAQMLAALPEAEKAGIHPLSAPVFPE
jgi:2-amino-4-hydroxy-6-hydroxymethyldihydropteridine diphosphokinase